MSYHDIKKIMQSTLGMFEEFSFSCMECGSCCRNRDTAITLTGYDIFRIAKYLGKTTEYVLHTYTYGYIGSDSKLPIAALKMREYDKSCVFLRSGKCSIHSPSAKPLTCALYPLGRFLPAEGENEHYRYFLQPVKCGKKEKHTVKQWLQQFDIESRDIEAKAWGKAIFELTKYMLAIDSEKQKVVAQMLLITMYLNYDIESKPYVEQLEDNMNTLERVLPGFNRNK